MSPARRASECLLQKPRRYRRRPRAPRCEGPPGPAQPALLNRTAQQHLGAKLGLDGRAGMNTRPVARKGLVAIVGARVEAELGGEFRTDDHLQRRAADIDVVDEEIDPLAGAEAAARKSLKLGIEFLAGDRRADPLLVPS